MRQRQPRVGPRPPVGGFPDLTAQQLERIVAMVRAGVPPRDAANVAGGAGGTYDHWKAKSYKAREGIYRDFRVQLEEGKSRAKVGYLLVVSRHALGEPGVSADPATGRLARPALAANPRLCISMLQMLEPRRYVVQALPREVEQAPGADAEGEPHGPIRYYLPERQPAPVPPKAAGSPPTIDAVGESVVDGDVVKEGTGD